MPWGWISTLYLLLVKIDSKPVEQSLEHGWGAYPDEAESYPSVDEDHFGLTTDVFMRVKHKAYQYRILNANVHNEPIPEEPLLSSLIFGDLIYTEEQLDWLHSRLTATNIRPHSRKKRSTIIDYGNFPVKKWTGVIPYTFSDLYIHSDYEKEYVRTAIRIWEAETCVRFKEFHISQADLYKDYVYIERKMACYSHYGRITGRQLVGLGTPCFTDPLVYGMGFVIHELGHVIGLYHEQSRFDRDDYVTVMLENVRSGESHNFGKFSQSEMTSYGVPYDYASVMHYGSRSFSVDRLAVDTIHAKDMLYQMTMGQRHSLSFLDSKVVNTAYCTGCNQQSIRCERGGYPDHNDCSRCRCPDGYSGQFCEQLSLSSPGVCHNTGEVNVSPEETCIRIGPYQNGTECTWLLRTQSPCSVEFWFEDDFDVLDGDTIGPTCLHYVEVQYKGPPTTPGPRFCGKQKPVFSRLKSDNNEILVIFRTPQILPQGQLPHGFTMCYKSVGSCSAASSVSSSTSNSRRTTTVYSTVPRAGSTTRISPSTNRVSSSTTKVPSSNTRYSTVHRSFTYNAQGTTYYTSNRSPIYAHTSSYRTETSSMTSRGMTSPRGTSYERVTTTTPRGTTAHGSRAALVENTLQYDINAKGYINSHGTKSGTDSYRSSTDSYRSSTPRYGSYAKTTTKWWPSGFFHR